MANIRQHGERWQVRVRRKGYPEQVRSFNSKTDATRWARQIESEIDKRTFQIDHREDPTALGQLLSRYRTEVTPLHRGHQVESIRLGKLLTHRLASTPLVNLQPVTIANYRDERLTQVTPGTVLRELQILSAIINHARREWGLTIANPVAAIRKPSPNRARTRRLQEDEEKRLMTSLELDERDAQGRFKGIRNPWIGPIVLFALETAMRRGELLCLRWDNVDLDRRTALLPLTKNGTARTVPLSTKALEILKGLPQSEDGRVFPLSANSLKLAYGRAVKRAGLENLRFHDLRREATSRLAKRLPNLVELAAVTGHADLRMLQVYYRPDPAELARKLL